MQPFKWTSAQQQTAMIGISNQQQQQRQRQQTFQRPGQTFATPSGLPVPQTQYPLPATTTPFYNPPPAPSQPFYNNAFTNQPAYNPTITLWLNNLTAPPHPTDRAPLLPPPSPASSQNRGANEELWDEFTSAAELDVLGLDLVQPLPTASQLSIHSATPTYGTAIRSQAPQATGAYQPGGPSGSSMQSVYAEPSGHAMLPSSPLAYAMNMPPYNSSMGYQAPPVLGTPRGFNVSTRQRQASPPAQAMGVPAYVPSVGYQDLAMPGTQPGLNVPSTPFERPRRASPLAQAMNMPPYNPSVAYQGLPGLGTQPGFSVPSTPFERPGQASPQAMQENELPYRPAVPPQRPQQAGWPSQRVVIGPTQDTAIDLTGEEEYDDTQDAPGSPDPDHVIDLTGKDKSTSPKTLGLIAYMAKNGMKPPPNLFANGNDKSSSPSKDEKIMKFSNWECTEREYEQMHLCSIAPWTSSASSDSPSQPKTKKGKGKSASSDSKTPSKRARTDEGVEEEGRPAKRHSPSKETSKKAKQIASLHNEPASEVVVAESSKMAQDREAAQTGMAAQSPSEPDEPVASIEAVDASSPPMPQETTETDSEFEREFLRCTYEETEEPEEYADSTNGELVLEGEVETGEVSVAGPVAAEPEQEQMVDESEASEDDLERELAAALEEDEEADRPADDATLEESQVQMDEESEESEEE